MGARGRQADKFTSTSSDDYTNDSDFIQHIVMGGHTSYASLMQLADSDNLSAYSAIKDSCAAILETSTYTEFDQVNQTIVRTTIWPADSDNDHTYYFNYRNILDQLNPLGSFCETPYTRLNIRHGVVTDSAGNNWGA